MPTNNRITLIQHAFLSACACAIILACASGSDGQSDDTSTTAPRGPQAGAPDEHCNLDPDRVYLIETPEPLITYTSLTDLGSSGPAFASSPRTRARRKQLGWNPWLPIQ